MLNFEMRTQILQPYCKTDLNDAYDIAYFEGLPKEMLILLIAGGFADPQQAQNDSPTISEFLQYMETHEQVTAHGYVVPKSRKDTRVSVEGIHQVAKDEERRKEFLALCRSADELSLYSKVMRAWWD